MTFSQFYKSLTVDQRKKLAQDTGTKTTYLRHVAHNRAKMSPTLAKKIEIASGGACPRIASRPDIFA